MRSEDRRIESAHAERHACIAEGSAGPSSANTRTKEGESVTEAKSLMRSTGSNCESQISGLSEGFQDLQIIPAEDALARPTGGCGD
jgi:hypothetical protein